MRYSNYVRRAGGEFLHLRFVEQLVHASGLIVGLYVVLSDLLTGIA